RSRRHFHRRIKRALSHAIVTSPPSGRNNRFLVSRRREKSWGEGALNSRSQPRGQSTIQRRIMFKKIALIAVVAGFLVAPMSILRAQDAGALLDLLVRKKLINDQEAEEVRAEL